MDREHKSSKKYLFTVKEGICVRKNWLLIFLQYNVGAILVHVISGMAWRTKPVFKWETVLLNQVLLNLSRLPRISSSVFGNKRWQFSCSFMTKK